MIHKDRIEALLMTTSEVRTVQVQTQGVLVVGLIYSSLFPEKKPDFVAKNKERLQSSGRNPQERKLGETKSFT